MFGPEVGVAFGELVGFEFDGPAMVRGRSKVFVDV